MVRRSRDLVEILQRAGRQQGIRASEEHWGLHGLGQPGPKGCLGVEVRAGKLMAEWSKWRKVEVFPFYRNKISEFYGVDIQIAPLCSASSALAGYVQLIHPMLST